MTACLGRWAHPERRNVLNLLNLLLTQLDWLYILPILPVGFACAKWKARDPDTGKGMPPTRPTPPWSAWGSSRICTATPFPASRCWGWHLRSSTRGVPLEPQSMPLCPLAAPAAPSGASRSQESSTCVVACHWQSFYRRIPLLVANITGLLLRAGGRRDAPSATSPAGSISQRGSVWQHQIAYSSVG